MRTPPRYDTTHSHLSRRALLRLLGSVPLAGVVSGVPLLTGCESGAPPAPRPGPSIGPAALPRFPETFVWGAATSAYQIEGAAADDGRGPSIWDTFSHASGNTRNGDTGDVATDHYHLWQTDLDLMKSLNLRTYRFSISWSRILPTGVGQVNTKGVDFYKRLVDGLHERGIAPVGTLFHWDLPQALQDKGGWENRDSAAWFADYAAVMFKALGDAVPTWLTLNEPKTVVNVGYRYGVHAPGKRDENAAMLACHHMLLAHGRAVQAYRAAGRNGRIGPALNLAPAYPADDSEAAKQAAVYADGQENRLYLDPILRGQYPADVIDVLPADAPMRKAIRDGDLAVIGSKVDVLGVNYYNPVVVDGGGNYITKYPTSIASWEQIYPDGLYDILTRVKRDYGDIPITITENGMPEVDEVEADGTVADAERISYVRDHLAALHRAVTEGVNVESYHVWSLLDNFEWAEGYDQRWGIVYVDFESRKRILKDSAKWYAQVAATGQLT